MSEYIKMPKELTAENGAKGLLIGEFSETVILVCSDCDEGITEDEETCEWCDGSGEYALKVAIGWDTIKSIYKMAADNLEIKE